MTTELTKALSTIEHLRASPLMKNHHAGLDGAHALLSALTQRPAAQTEREAHEPNAKLMELADRIDHEQLWRLSGLAQMDLPQEKQDRVLAGVMLRRYADLLGNGGWRIFPPRSGVSFRASTLDKVVEMARRDEARRASLPAPQQATPEPIPAEQAKWCEYVAGMVDCWVSAEWSNYHHKDEDRRIKAIAGIIERRLWALQKQPATPEPVGEPVGTVVHAKLNGQAKPWVTVALNQDADLPDGAKLFTHPAPGVPEGWRELIEKMVKGIDHLAELARQWEPDYSSGADRKGWVLAKNARDEAVDMLAAAQAKGGA